MDNQKKKSADKKEIKEVSTKERVERVKSFMGVSNKDIKSKEKHLENKLEYIKKGNSKNFKKKGSWLCYIKHIYQHH